MTENPLAGFWKLRAFTVIDSTQNKSYPMGEKPQGYLVYLVNGFMMVHLGASHRPCVNAASILDLEVNDDLLNMVRTYNSYSGRYEIKNNVVYHHIDFCFFPNWSGKTEEREFYRRGNYIDLKGILQTKTETCTFIAEWEGVNP